MARGGDRGGGARIFGVRREGVQPPARSSSAGFSIFPEGHNFNVFAEACSLFGFARSAEAVRVTFVWGLERPRETDPADDEFARDPRNPLGARALEETARRLGSKFENPTTPDQERAAVPAFDAAFDAIRGGAGLDALVLRRPARVGSHRPPAQGSKLGGMLRRGRRRCDARGVRRWVRVPDVARAHGAALRRYGRGESNDGAVRWFAPDRPGTPPAPGRGGPTLTNIPADNWGSNEGRVASVAVTAVLRTSSVSSSTAELVAEHEFWEGWFENKLAGAPRNRVEVPDLAHLDAHRDGDGARRRRVDRAHAVAGVRVRRAPRCVAIGPAGAARDDKRGVIGGEPAGSAALLGWTMGVIEAVCTMVLVGLSLDYVLHVAGAYVRTPEADGRRERAKGRYDRSVFPSCLGRQPPWGLPCFCWGAR